MTLLPQPVEFEWDSNNREHIRLHQVEPGECEQVFFNIPFTIVPDTAHSKSEERYFALGRTNSDRMLVVIFTMRNQKLRIITARDVNRKERGKYETQKDPEV